MLYVCSLDLLESIMFYECYVSRFSRRSDKSNKNSGICFLLLTFHLLFTWGCTNAVNYPSITCFLEAVLFLPTAQIRETLWTAFFPFFTACVERERGYCWILGQSLFYLWLQHCFSFSFLVIMTSCLWYEFSRSFVNSSLLWSLIQIKKLRSALRIKLPIKVSYNLG